MSIEIESADVVRLIAQYLKENNLTETFKTLIEETGISLNIVDSIDTLYNNVLDGHWDLVLQALQDSKVPNGLLIDLYEHIIYELMELREVSTARSLLRQSDPMLYLRQFNSDRYVKLEEMISKTYFDPKEIYPEGVNKTKLRQKLAQKMKIAPPSRLLTLLGQSLKWQQHNGLLPPGTSFDLFQGRATSSDKEEETYPTQAITTIKFEHNSYPQVLTFSPDGQFLVSGSSDGFIEVWNYMTGKIRMDLKYQEKESFMLMEHSVTALKFNDCSELLASGSSSGQIKVWKVLTGQCVYRLENAHSQSVNSILFTSEHTRIFSCSNDTLIRLHSLKGSSVLKQYSGHTSFVNSISLFEDDHRLLSASSDGCVKIWSVKSAECLNTYKPNIGSSMVFVPINSVFISASNPNNLVICNHSQNILCMNKQNQGMKSYSLPQENAADLLLSCRSPRGEWLYVVGENNYVFCLNFDTGKFEYNFKAHEKSVVGISHHPQKNIIATCSIEGSIVIWK